MQHIYAQPYVTYAGVQSSVPKRSDAIWNTYFKSDLNMAATEAVRDTIVNMKAKKRVKTTIILYSLQSEINIGNFVLI
jgi:hypothetical protein